MMKTAKMKAAKNKYSIAFKVNNIFGLDEVDDFPALLDVSVEEVSKLVIAFACFSKKNLLFSLGSRLCAFAQLTRLQI